MSWLDDKIICLEDSHFRIIAEQIDVWVVRMTTGIDILYGLGWTRDRHLMLHVEDPNMDDDQLRELAWVWYLEHRDEMLGKVA